MTETMLKGYQCERCGHKWTPRENEHQRVCPKCKSTYRDLDRKQDMAKRLAGIKNDDPDCDPIL
jgi:Zn finger protein HypA/HybF involved in hydrogenase expression